MKRHVRALTGAGCLVLLAVLAAGVRGQDDKDAKPARLVVKCLEEDTTLEFNGTKTKQTGLERHFTTPPLKPSPKKYYYIIKAVWQPNNYETFTRTRKVYVEPGKETVLDLREKASPKEPDHIVIRYVPTPDEVVSAMLKLARVGKDDVVYDLGCGDGRIVVAAVSKFGAKRGVGVDLDPKRIKESKDNAKAAKVEDRVEFRMGDVMKLEDLDKATVVTLYLSDDLNEQLRPILQKKLKPGTRIVSHRFLMGKWEPEKTETHNVDGEDFKVHLWTIKGADKDKEKDKAKDKDKDDD
jgi:uncharacterized protein (TIGR03000 family)